MIEVNDLSKTYHVHRKDAGLMGSIRSLFHRKRVAKHAVRNVSFEVCEGEIVGLVGANGAGKTTLVKMLSGIIHPTSGDARVLGHRPWERSDELRRQVALIMGQKAQLWWDLPAADCFLLLREIYQVPRKRFEATLDQLVDMLDVRGQLDVQIRRLSLGERMKMELVAALLHSPRIVYLDEPTIGLDLAAQRAIRDFILQYSEESRPAMILTSHYMEDIERLCKRIMVIREGEIVYDGLLATIAASYATHKVVTAHLHSSDQPLPSLEDLAELGEVLEASESVIRVLAPRAQVAHAAGVILERCPVADIQIDEDEIGSIIERIISARGEEDS